LPHLAELAELENTVIRLARELRKTQRRCNALSKLFIPAHRETISAITSALEERERESFTLLKMIRARL
jgi:V/A-type H+/Na+-transporting ATPase subunit D